MDRLNIPAKFEVRSFIHSWDNRGYSKNLGSPCIHPRSIFSQIFNPLLFAWTLWIYLPNLTLVALPIPEIIGGTSKIWGVPGFVHAPYFPKFLKGFCSHGPVNTSAKFEVRSFTSSWDTRGYSNNLGSPWIRPRSIFSQNFKGLLFAWTLWIYLPNLTFVALPIPEIIGGTSKIWVLFAWTMWIYLPSLKFVGLHVPEIMGGTQKIWPVPGYAQAPFSPKFFMGLWSDGHCECIGQICSPLL